MSGFAIFFIIFVAVCALGGFGRGTVRQGLRLVTTVISCIVAFIVTSNLSGELLAAFDSIGSMQELIYALKSEPEFAELITPKVESVLLAFDPDVLGYSFGIFVGIALSAVFTVVFLIADVIIKIAYGIVSFILKFGKGASLPSKAVGAVLAAIEGAAVAAILLLPVANIAGMVNDTYDLIEQSECDGKDAIMDNYELEVAPFAEDGTLAIIEKVGGRALFDKFCTIEIDGEKRNYREDAVIILKLVILDLQEFSETDWKSLDNGDKNAIESTINTLGSSKYLKNVGVAIFHAMHAAAKGGTELLEVEPPLDSLMNAVLTVLGETSNETFIEDLNTLKDIYFILSDCGVLVDMANGENLTDAFISRDANGDTAIAKILEVIEKNPRTQPLINEIAKISVSLLSSQYDLGGDVTEIYESLKDGMADVLAVDPSDKEALANELGTVLYDNGISLDKGVIDNMAEYVAENHGDDDTLTEEELDYLILNYYDAYLEYIESNAN